MGVAFVVVRVGLGVLGHHEVKDNLRSPIAQVTFRHKESVTGLQWSHADSLVILVGASSDHERDGLGGQSRPSESMLVYSLVVFVYVSISAFGSEDSSASLHLPHRHLPSGLQVRNSLVDLFKACARRPILLPESHRQPRSESTQQVSSYT